MKTFIIMVTILASMQAFAQTKIKETIHVQYTAPNHTTSTADTSTPSGKIIVQKQLESRPEQFRSMTHLFKIMRSKDVQDRIKLLNSILKKSYKIQYSSYNGYHPVVFLVTEKNSPDNFEIYLPEPKDAKTDDVLSQLQIKIDIARRHSKRIDEEERIEKLISDTLKEFSNLKKNLECTNS